MRIKLTIEYEGTEFCGWQRQKEETSQRPSVQASIEDAFPKFCRTQVSLVGAGRTDAGVHALGQVAHLDLPERYEVEEIQGALNHYLRHVPISILHVAEVDSSFHARFSACERGYLYRILCRRAPPALDRKRIWQHSKFLDIEAMQKAASCLIGKHDFSAFRAAGCQAKKPVKHLTSCDIHREGEQILIRLTAPSFLYHQVRNIVGTLAKIGSGVWPVEAMPCILASKDRNQAGPTVPACGLYLTHVLYSKTHLE